MNLSDVMNEDGSLKDIDGLKRSLDVFAIGRPFCDKCDGGFIHTGLEARDKDYINNSKCPYCGNLNQDD